MPRHYFYLLCNAPCWGWHVIHITTLFLSESTCSPLFTIIRTSKVYTSSYTYSCLILRSLEVAFLSQGHSWVPSHAPRPPNTAVVHTHPSMRTPASPTPAGIGAPGKLPWAQPLWTNLSWLGLAGCQLSLTMTPSLGCNPEAHPPRRHTVTRNIPHSAPKSQNDALSANNHCFKKQTEREHHWYFCDTCPLPENVR